MYQYVSHRENQLLLPDDFFLPFGGKLNKENRWVKMVQQIVENPYLQYFVGLKGYQDHPPFHPSLNIRERSEPGCLVAGCHMCPGGCGVPNRFELA